MKKKKQQKQQPCSANQEGHKPNSWPDLPHQLVLIIGKYPSLEKNIHFGGVIKSWRAAPKYCNADSILPWLQLLDPDCRNSEKYCRFITRRGVISTSSPSMVWGCWNYYFLRTLPRYPWKSYVGCSNGILVAEAEPLYVYNLWNPVQRGWYHLPLRETQVPFKLAVLSSSPQDENCSVMVLAGTSHPAFAFYKLQRGRMVVWEQPQWTKQDCTLSEPIPLCNSKRQQIMQFTNAIGFKGKFYALSLQGTLAVVEEIDGCFKITALSATRAVPSVSSNHFREYLLESESENFLVFLISRNSSVNIVDGVEVYQLNLGRLSWVKLESIGDKTVFLGTNCSVSVLASKVGCMKNCVYFRQPITAEWWVFDMESRSISQGWNEGNLTRNSPIWNEPIEEENDMIGRE